MPCLFFNQININGRKRNIWGEKENKNYMSRNGEQKKKKNLIQQTIT